MPEPITVGAIALAFKALEKPLNELYLAATGTTQKVLKKWNAANKRDALSQTILETEKIRTIFSSVPIPLSSFYYPSKVSDYRSARPPKLVKNLDDISKDQNILILGTVGQGKSILMRYLSVEELKKGLKIPIFLELRTLEPSDTVQSKIVESLEILGFDEIDDAVFEFLLSNGKFVFFLDGFDELKRELALSVQSELTKLMKKAPKTRWVISSRPGSLSGHISGLPSLVSVEITPLADDDFEPFLHALNVEKEMREKLVSAIMSSSGEIKGVLKTPLMLTLLNLTFGTSTHIPETLHEFYESMFLFLVFRHDETKPGYVRQKATNLSNAELQNAFEHFCFLSKDYGVSLSDEDFALCAKNTVKLSDLSFTPEGFRTDLTETVCLMQRDGIRSAFIHRSIQEFFTAFFIKHLGAENTVKAIYENIKGAALLSWQQELRFLEQIDKYRYIEYHRLPAINKFLSDCQFQSSRKLPVTKTAFLKFLAGQPIVSVINRHSVQNPKRNYWIVIAAAESSYTPFTSAVGKIFQAEGTIRESISDFKKMTGRIVKDGDEPDVVKNISFQIKSEDISIQLNKFRELAKKAEREKIKLDRLLAERKENFRDILLKSATNNR